VAWDYSTTQRGEYPGYDDAARNMPLPAGRNALAAREILRIARPECLAGFSSDLTILQANSVRTEHDGLTGSFYETLKRLRFTAATTLRRWPRWRRFTAACVAIAPSRFRPPGPRQCQRFCITVAAA